jgi:hypothetical protein
MPHEHGRHVALSTGEKHRSAGPRGIPCALIFSVKTSIGNSCSCTRHPTADAPDDHDAEHHCRKQHRDVAAIGDSRHSSAPGTAGRGPTAQAGLARRRNGSCLHTAPQLRLYTGTPARAPRSRWRHSKTGSSPRSLGRSPAALRMQRLTPDAEQSDHREPDQHHGAERFTDSPRAEPLH